MTNTANKSSALVMMAALTASGMTTLGELAEHCSKTGVSPQQLADSTRCSNCNALDSACIRSARQSGETCCKQCRDWPMHVSRQRVPS